MTGQGDQPVVEGAVERHERVEILTGAGAADLDHPVREVVELLDVGGDGVRDGEGGQLRLQGQAQVEDALELGDRPGGHPRAAVGADLDQALGREPGERLADRRPAHAQALGELDLTEPGAGGERADEDQLAQLAERPLGGRHRSCQRSHPLEDCVQT